MKSLNLKNRRTSYQKFDDKKTNLNVKLPKIFLQDHRRKNKQAPVLSNFSSNTKELNSRTAATHHLRMKSEPEPSFQQAEKLAAKLEKCDKEQTFGTNVNYDDMEFNSTMGVHLISQGFESPEPKHESSILNSRPESGRKGAESQLSSKTKQRLATVIRKS